MRQTASCFFLLQTDASLPPLAVLFSYSHQRPINLEDPRPIRHPFIVCTSCMYPAVRGRFNTAYLLCTADQARTPLANTMFLLQRTRHGHLHPNDPCYDPDITVKEQSSSRLCLSSVSSVPMHSNCYAAYSSSKHATVLL